MRSEPRRWLPLLLLAVLTVGAHARDLTGEFVYDDYLYIVPNAAVQGGIGHWREFFTDLAASGNPKTGHYRPIVGLTYALDTSLGLGTFGFKITQVFLHLLTVLGLYWLVGMLGRAGPGLPRGTALAAAAWMAIAPFNVDAVHYLTARSSVLCGLFSVLSVACFVRMRRARMDVAGWYVAHLACLVLAVFSKETGLAVPAAVLAVDLLLLKPTAGGSGRLRPWWPYAPYVLGVGLAWTLMPNVHRAFSYFAQVFGTEWRVAAAIRCLAENVRLMLLPTGLSITHPIGSNVHLTDPGTLGAAVFVAALVAGAWVVRRRAPLVAFGAAWYFLFIAPSTFVVLSEILQEHRGYAASMGVAMVLGWGAARLLAVAGRYRVPAVAGLAAVAVLLLVTTYARQQVWANELTLWTQSLKVYPDSPRAYVRIGEYYKHHGQWEQAANAMRKAVSLAPTWLVPVLGLGSVYESAGRTEAAERVYLDAYRAMPDNVRTFQLLAELYGKSGQLAKLVPLYHDAIARWPKHADDTRLALGRVQLALGDPDAAEDAVRQVLARHPERDTAAFQMGLIARKRGTPEEAVRWLGRAVELAPGKPGYRLALGEALLEAGRADAAVTELRAATAAVPAEPGGHFLLARALEAAGNQDAAAAQYRRFLALAPAEDPQGRPALARQRLAALGAGGTLAP